MINTPNEQPVYCTKQRVMTVQPNSTSPVSTPAFRYGGRSTRLTHRAYKPWCFCLTHSSGKLDFPSLENGIAQRDYFITNLLSSNPGYFRPGTAFSLKQTDRRRVEMADKPLIICSPPKLLLSFLINVFALVFHLHERQFSSN